MVKMSVLAWLKCSKRVRGCRNERFGMRADHRFQSETADGCRPFTPRRGGVGSAGNRCGIYQLGYGDPRFVLDCKRKHEYCRLCSDLMGEAQGWSTKVSKLQRDFGPLDLQWDEGLLIFMHQ
jgi:hypothetical protein